MVEGRQSGVYLDHNRAIRRHKECTMGGTQNLNSYRGWKGKEIVNQERMMFGSEEMGNMEIRLDLEEIPMRMVDTKKR